MSEELKPCPFCGDIPDLEAELIEHEYSNGAHVVYICHHCFSGMEIITESRCWNPHFVGCSHRENAVLQCIVDWNNRQEPPKGEA